MKWKIQVFKAERFRYIFRNFGRKKKQTFFTLLCITISAFSILINMALANGIQWRLREGICQTMSGQLTLYGSGGADINILESQLKEQRKFQWSDEDARRLKRAFEGLSVYRRIRFGSLISYGDETSYIFIHALEKPHLDKIKNLLVISRGRMPQEKGEILIGETLAGELHCQVGDSLLLVAENTHDYMSDEIGIVAGIFEERGLAIFFNYMGFLPYGMGKEIVGLEGDETLEVILNPAGHAELSETELHRMDRYIGGTGKEVALATWDKTIPLFFTIVRVWEAGGLFTRIIFIVFSLVILVNLTSLIVNSRRKEFGTLLAMGFSWKEITAMLCLEYFFLGCIAVGIAVGMVNSVFLSLPEAGLTIASKDIQAALMSDVLRPFLYLKDIGYVWLLFSMTVLGAVGISILRIRRLSPVFLIKTF